MVVLRTAWGSEPKPGSPVRRLPLLLLLLALLALLLLRHVRSPPHVAWMVARAWHIGGAPTRTSLVGYVARPCRPPTPSPPSHPRSRSRRPRSRRTPT